MTKVPCLKALNLEPVVFSQLDRNFKSATPIADSSGCEKSGSIRKLYLPNSADLRP
jgi:hypothetical protein